jgi:hypothetical protein
MDLGEIGGEGVKWIHLAQGPVVGSCENGKKLQVPQKVGNLTS